MSVAVLWMVHLLSTLVMVGVIWFVQVVHYPLFAKVGTKRFGAYEASHQQRTSWVVIPPMIAELATGALLAWRLPEVEMPFALSLGLLAVIWVSTFVLQVPCHRVLSDGFDPAAHRFLVRSNWLRTAAWTLRGLLVLVTRDLA